jgi:hypothetical protein
MRYLVLAVVAAMLAASATLAFQFLPGGDELAQRKAIEDTVATHFRDGRFADLETLAEDYRATRARSGSGLWKLTLFYAGVNNALTGKRHDADLWRQTEAQVKKWIAAYPGSPTPHLAYARFFINRAWAKRGDRDARQVSRRDMEAFHEDLGRAGAYLEEHKAVAALLKRIGDDPLHQAWRHKAYYEQCRDWAFAAPTPGKPA